MIKILKKVVNLQESVPKVLSEEEIQRKLYGEYKPGTLGKVIKVQDEKKVKEATDLDIPKELNLFSAIEEPPVQEELLMNPAKSSSIDLKTFDPAILNFTVPEEKDVKPIPTEITSANDDELLQLNLDKKESGLFSDEKNDFIENLQFTIVEIIDKVKSVNPKTYLIAFGIFISVVLAFSFLSSYVKEDGRERGYSEKTTSNERLETSSLQSKSFTLEPASTPANNVPAIVPPAKKNEVPLPTSNQVNSLVGASTGLSILQEGTNAIAPAKPKRAPKAPGDATPFYSVQICVSNNLKATENLVESLKGAGVEAFFTETITPRGKTLYFVYGGKFSKKEEAATNLQNYLKKPEFKEFPDSYVIHLNLQESNE